MSLESSISFMSIAVRHSWEIKLDNPDINLLILARGSATIEGAYIGELGELKGILPHTHFPLLEVDELLNLGLPQLQGKEAV